jgi:hypothetical protein
VKFVEEIDVEEEKQKVSKAIRLLGESLILNNVDVASGMTALQITFVNIAHHRGMGFEDYCELLEVYKNMAEEMWK